MKRKSEYTRGQKQERPIEGKRGGEGTIEKERTGVNGREGLSEDWRREGGIMSE